MVDTTAQAMANTAFCILRTADPDQHAAGVDLREEPEKGPRRLAEPVAARRHEEPRALRRGPHEFSDQEFRRLCVLVRAELKAHPELDGADLMEQLKTACARRQLRYDSSVLGRVLAVVQPRSRVMARYREPLGMHWRDRCAHTPRCTLPVHCALRATREGR